MFFGLDVGCGQGNTYLDRNGKSMMIQSHNGLQNEEDKKYI